MSFARNFRMGPEGKYSLQVRAEFQNIFNRHFYSAPTHPGRQSYSPPHQTAAGVYQRWIRHHQHHHGDRGRGASAVRTSRRALYLLARKGRAGALECGLSGYEIGRFSSLADSEGNRPFCFQGSYKDSAARNVLRSASEP